VTWLRLRRRNWRDYVSAYVDGELQGADLAWFDDQLRSVPDAAHAVELERATSRLISETLPEVAVPRSFALTAEMAAANRPEPVRPAFDSARLFGRLSAGAAVAAAVALAFVTVIDLSGGEGAGDDDAPAAAMSAPESLSATAAGEEARTADGDASGGGTGAAADSSGTVDQGRPGAAAPGDTAQRETGIPEGTTALTLEADEADDRGTGGWRAVQVILGIVLVASVGGYIFNRQSKGR